MTDYIFDTKTKSFYAKQPDGTYRLLELYLPSATGTYGEPIKTTKDRWIRELNELDGHILSHSPFKGKPFKVRLNHSKNVYTF